MHINRYDEVIDEVSTIHELNWNNETKIAILVRFLDQLSVFQEWKKFLEETALEEVELCDSSDGNNEECE